MRERQKKLVITFRTTAGAMAMEKYCHEESLPGRLIPVPRTITAGCGMCWTASPEYRGGLEELLVRRQLDADGVYELML